MKKFLLIILILFPFPFLNASEVWVTYGIQLGFSTNKDIERSKYQIDLSSLVSRNQFIYFNRRALHQKMSKRGEDWRFSWMGGTHVSKVNCKEKIIYIGGMSGDGEGSITYKVGNEWWHKFEYERGYRSPRDELVLKFTNKTNKEFDEDQQNLYDYVCN